MLFEVSVLKQPRESDIFFGGPILAIGCSNSFSIYKADELNFKKMITMHSVTSLLAIQSKQVNSNT